MPAKELKKGGKPAQVKGVCDVVLDENKDFLRTFFAGEAPAAPTVAMRVKSLGAEHEKRTASAGIVSYGRGMSNTTMTFGTDTDFILTTEDGGDDVVVPKRFLNHRGEVHQSMFKVGDVIITVVNGCEKSVNIGMRNGAMVTKGRGWHEVKAWIPADKVARAVKEGRLRLLEKQEEMAKTAEMLAAEAAQKAAVDAIYAAEVAAMKAMDAAGGGGGDEELGSWY
jgi:hypothetical protein